MFWAIFISIVALGLFNIGDEKLFKLYLICLFIGGLFFFSKGIRDMFFMDYRF